MALRVKRVALRGKRGRSTFRVSLRGVKPGRYTLTLVAADAAGNRSRPASVRFTVSRATRTSRRHAKRHGSRRR